MLMLPILKLFNFLRHLLVFVELLAWIENPEDGEGRAGEIIRYATHGPRVSIKTVQRRLGLDASEEDLIANEVADALAATAEERMAAAVALLDTAYELWRSRGLGDDAGLCRFPGCAP